jgi:hypothetical protein
MLGESPLAVFGMLQTRKSPSMVCAASMSDFCFEDEPCQASLLRGDGGLFVLNVWRIVKDGCKFAMRMEPFIYLRRVSIHLTNVGRTKWKAYPIAKVRQSDEGASAVMGSNIVRADICSDVDGSNKITLPWEFPIVWLDSWYYCATGKSYAYQRQCSHSSSILPLGSPHMTRTWQLHCQSRGPTQWLSDSSRSSRPVGRFLGR